MNRIILGLLVAVCTFLFAGVGAVSAQEPMIDDANKNVGWFEPIQEKIGKHPNRLKPHFDKKPWAQKPRLKPKSEQPPLGNKQRPQLSEDELRARREQAMERQAEIFGLSVDELKARLEAGQKMHEIAEEQGITREQAMERKKAARHEIMRQRLGNLVEKGRITQEQVDERLQKIQERLQNPPENRSIKPPQDHKPWQNHKPAKKPGFFQNLGNRVGQWFGSLINL